ncbi:unnamed protein product [Didymodactylos carnosus]|uniref:G-protein coupled receptors family 1 profile domain-containing protein n=1 Tax=Didymodactylos carnosus TaxID=1234261 RepID=A0A813QL22_9BILA|nr:unnamed protein product [Didymodactylos carnosus]CAF0839705.1 unnamed protein product [Didymodactylos carnosus]CAF3549925.1 unnamed protein product [Didymodactylos carnosus]CAF3624592.1 unnamed protein product [Didymodactylos carnosus]
MSINCSQETYKIDISTISIKYIAGGWLTLIFCLFGIITNIFTVVVLCHPRMRNSSTHVYLLALSACNIFLLAGLMINYSLKSIATYPQLLQYLNKPDGYNKRQILANAYEQFYAHVAPFTTPLLSMLLLCSTYLTVLVSVDRYLLLCWPVFAEKFRTCKIAIRCVLIIALIINLYCLPHWFEYKTAYRNSTYILGPTILKNETLSVTGSGGLEDDSDTYLVELGYTKLGLNPIYLSIYRFYLNIPVTFLIPFSLLLLCNCSMIHKLVLIKRKKRKLGQRMKADIRITVMLIVIVLVFLSCRSLNLAVNLMTKMQPCLNRNSLQRYNTWANLLVAFNGFCNFFLFAVFGQRFREMVLYIFFRQQYPFNIGGDHTSNRAGYTATPDPIRRQSRRYSANESDLLQTMSHRRPSATMATLNSDMKRQSTSQLNTLKPSREWKSKFLNTPTLFSFKRRKKLISLSSNKRTDLPFLNQHQINIENINDEDDDNNNDNINNNGTHLALPIVINNSHSLIPSPSCLKKLSTDITSNNNHNNIHLSPTTNHRTIMFNDHIEFM